METYVDSRLINIGSEYADVFNNGSFLSDVIFSFAGLLQSEDDIVYSQISIMNAQIPISYYIINEYNNVLEYSINNISYSVTFSVGNYNANSFITEFVSKMPSGFSCVLNRITGKYSFTHSSNFIFLGTSTIFKVLGFIPNTNYSSINKVLNGVNPCNFVGVSKIRIASNELLTYTMDSFSGNFSNTLQTVSVNSGSFGMLLYENSNSFKALLRNNTLNYFDIQIFDENNNLINFNGIHWNMTLQLDITRKKSNSIGKINEAPVENVEQQQQQSTETLPVSSGDDDLDLLLYQNNIYQ